MNKKSEFYSTKALTLKTLLIRGFNVPEFIYFSINDWINNKENLLDKILSTFKNDKLLAVRSSAISEDTATSSNAGAYDSFLSVEIKKDKIKQAINSVIKSLDGNKDSQVIVQKMVLDVAMSGVLMTKNLEDGSPYYVINYDDSTGRTDSVTKGDSINKTVYIYNGVNDKDFDSELLLSLVRVVRELEKESNYRPLDIEFAIDKDKTVHLLQARPITTLKNWDVKLNKKVSDRFKYLRAFVDSTMNPKPGILGSTSLLGIMSDWNPAEMIGVTPKPLASSLYRSLITKETWSKARELMGYRPIPNMTDLMVSLFGRVYIDVRNSFNSFLPNNLPDKLSEKIVNTYINKLSNEPHLHDKIEFEIAFTCSEFGLEDKIQKRFPEIFTKNEINQIVKELNKITLNAIEKTDISTLYTSIDLINELKERQNNSSKNFKIKNNSYANNIIHLMEECKNLGTYPFSVIARHAFIAEVFLRNFVDFDIITNDRVDIFRKSIDTIATQMSNDFYKVHKDQISRKLFLKKYGHLRPSSYDILSKSYNERPEIFDGDNFRFYKAPKFQLTSSENKKLLKNLAENKFFDITPDRIIQYIKDAIVAREYAKYVFTFHIDQILKNVELWGKSIGLQKEQLSFLSIENITETVFSPLNMDQKKYYLNKVRQEELNLSIANSFKLNYLIRSSRDINIVPIQRNEPNYIGSKIVDGSIVKLNPYKNKVEKLKDKIVLIESADPGYDWLFSRKIKALVTKYGGVNSHMSIRCAELGITAVIGCGEQNFERLLKNKKCIIDGKLKKVFKYNSNKKIF
jgi:phosphoenolpyruvate synthase/pyruvate phosphate dikinase